MRNKKGYSLNDASGLVMILVVIAIIIGLGMSILQNFQKQQCNVANSALGTHQWNDSAGQCQNGAGVLMLNMSYGYNATEQGMLGLKQFSDFQPTIAIVIVAGLILGIIGTVLYNRME